MVKRITYLYVTHIFAEVEAKRVESQGQPYIISSDTGENSFVLDFSETLGKKINKGQRIKDVKDGINIVPVDYDYTRQVCEEIILSLDSFSPDVISDSYGQFYLDLSGTESIFGNPLDTGKRILKFIKDKFNLNSSIGIGTNKLIAYLAGTVSDINTVLEIDPKDELSFLKPVPTYLLPEVEEEIIKIAYDKYNLKTVGKISDLSEEDIFNLFGKRGKLLYEYSNNIANH